jgi:hypothetical protein
MNDHDSIINTGKNDVPSGATPQQRARQPDSRCGPGRGRYAQINWEELAAKSSIGKEVLL